MKFATELIGGKLVRRYRRFLVDVELENGEVVTAHCPNSGTMVGCCQEGRSVLLSETANVHRRNKYTWEFIKVANTWVGVNVSTPRKLVVEALTLKALPVLSSYGDMTLDASYGRGNKVDIVMHGAEQNAFINVYHVSWAEEGIARFPETPNARARKGLRDLTEIARQGHHAVAFFLVQRADCTRFAPAAMVDPEWGRLFREAASAGVDMMAYRTAISRKEISLERRIPVAID
jgi:sugar fermentation stimulation protein A